MYNMQQTTTNVCHKWSALIWTQSVAGPNRFIHTENECQNGPKWRVHGSISDVMVTNVKSEFSHILMLVGNYFGCSQMTMHFVIGRVIRSAFGGKATKARTQTSL